MKKLIISLAFLLAACASAFAFTDTPMWVTSALTNDSAAMTQPGYCYGLMVTPDGTNNVTINTYDNDSAAGGKIIHPAWTLTGSGGSQTLSFNPPMEIRNGIYVDVTTTGTVSYMVYYRRL